MLLIQPQLISITLLSLLQGWVNHWNISFSSSLYSKKQWKIEKKKINQILDIKDIKHIFTTSKLGQKITACIKTSISAVHNCTLDLNWSNIQLQIKRKVYKCANEILEICCRKCIYGTVVRTLLLFACFSFWGENPFVKCNLLFNFWVLSFYVRREH